MARRDYVGTGITVHWDADLCEHAGECVRGAPAVFDTTRRPWIDAEAGTAEAIAAVVDRCPSRALTYSRTDGAPLGPSGVTEPATPTQVTPAPLSAPPPPAAAPEPAMEATTIEPRADGPLVITGTLRLTHDDGTTTTETDRLFLCRCGASDDKPRCDGTHKRIGFAAPGVSVARRP